MTTRPESPDFAAKLPTETWDYIFAELPTEDLMRCKLVCSRFAAIGRVIERRYKGALTISAMADGQNSSMPLRRRIDMVRQYHRAWERLSIPSPRGNLNETDGHYILSSHVRHMPAPLFLPCGWLSIVNPDLGLLFVRSPAWSNFKEPRNNGWWVAGQIFLSQLPVYVAYRIDPSQDLLILMGDTEEDEEETEEFPDRDIHVRSLSTGLQHPLAACPILEQSEHPIYELSSFRVFGDLCAILARCNDRDDDRVLHIWDWRSGDLLYTESGYDAWGDVVSSLGPRTILVAHDECLQIHTFSADGEVRTDTLEIPRFLPTAIQIWTTVSQPYTQAEPGRGFASDPASEIVIINMTRVDVTRPDADVGEDPGDAKFSVLLVIKVSALLELAQLPGEPALSVPWAEWGPGSSRIIEVPETCLWEAPTTFGRRALISFYHRGVPMLSVLDFDFVPETPRWEESPQAFETSGEWITGILEAPITEDWWRWFEQEDRFVTSNVPCRIRSRRMDLPARMVGASLYENGIVVKIANDDHCDYMVLPLKT